AAAALCGEGRGDAAADLPGPGGLVLQRRQRDLLAVDHLAVQRAQHQAQRGGGEVHADQHRLRLAHMLLASTLRSTAATWSMSRDVRLECSGMAISSPGRRLATGKTSSPTRTSPGNAASTPASWCSGAPHATSQGTPSARIASTVSSTERFQRMRSEEHTSELQSRENLVCR